MTLDAVNPREPAPPRDADREPAAAIDVRNAALTVLAVIAVVLLLQYAQAMVIPIVLGILISYALEPIVKALERIHVPRVIGAALVLLALVGSVGWLLYGLRDEGNVIVRQLPEAAHRLRERFEKKPRPVSAIQQVQKAASELEKAADTAAPSPAPSGVMRIQIEPKPFAISDYLVWGSVNIATAAGQLVLILFLVYFLLASGDLYRRKLVKIVGPSLTKKKITVQILEENRSADRSVSRRPGVHEHGGGHRNLARIPLPRA